MAIRHGIQVQGLREFRRACRTLGVEADAEMKRSAVELSKELANLVQAAGRAEGRQARVAANTVEVFQGKGLPTIRAGQGSRSGSKRDKDVTLGSEFGATRKFGWYDPKKHPRYYDSVGKQYKPHRGSASYWFFTTVEANDARVGAKYAEALDRMANKWGAGG